MIVTGIITNMIPTNGGTKFGPCELRIHIPCQTIGFITHFAIRLREGAGIIITAGAGIF